MSCTLDQWAPRLHRAPPGDGIMRVRGGEGGGASSGFKAAQVASCRGHDGGDGGSPAALTCGWC